MRKKKTYQIDDILPVRLTEKAGATDEVIDYINNLDVELGQTMIKALKFWIRTQDKSNAINERIRNAIEDETRVMNSSRGRYGQNRGPYKKTGESEEVLDLRRKLKEAQTKDNKKAASSHTSPQAHIVDKREDVEDQTPLNIHQVDAEDEIYGGGTEKKPIGNPMQRALNSIPGRG